MKRTLLAFVVTAGLSGSVFGAGSTLDRLEATANFDDGIQTDIAGLLSVRSMDPVSSLITSGDTYSAAVIGQSSVSAAFVTSATGRVTTFTYDLAPTAHGTLAGSGATVNITESESWIDPSTMRVVIAATTADSSPLWISGLTIGTDPVIQGRYDVGAGAFSNGLLWDNLPPITGLTITNALFIDGAVAATSTPLANGRTLPEMGSAVIWNGVVGSAVDETQMIFTITIPEPASLGALAMVLPLFTRRRNA